MRHNVAGRKFDRPTGHRISMYRNLMTDILDHEKVVTTEAKAKEVQGMTEKIITLGKKGGLHSRRQVASVLMDGKVTDKLFKELGPRYAERHGGYTRIVKLGARLGDGASMVQIELVK
jgi:large subunit ribosomal protein L17